MRSGWRGVCRGHLGHSTRDRKTQHICFALDDAKKAGEITVAQRDAATAVIEYRLGIHVTVGGWLHHVHGVPLGKLKSNGRKLQATRHAWLDSLIKEFSK